jgi:DNA invertase Pin-like site-specific DNA recombinase
MILGYARVSTIDQTTDNQIPKLEQAGCTKIYKETASGGRWDRPELQACLAHLREGDTLVVWKLDRLSRSLSDLLRILEQVNKARATFKSLTESLDISGPCGRLMMHMLAAFNQFEREIIRERTKAGLDYARSQGRIGGGKPKLTEAQRKQAITWIESGEKTQADVARFFDVDRAAISRMMSKAKANDDMQREVVERKATKRNGKAKSV